MRDDKFSNHVKTVFDSYDDGLADQGWEQLEKKYPLKTKSKPLYWWLSGVAAAILFIGFILFYNPETTINDIDQKVVANNPDLTLPKADTALQITGKRSFEKKAPEGEVEKALVNELTEVGLIANNTISAENELRNSGNVTEAAIAVVSEKNTGDSESSIVAARPTTDSLSQKLSLEDFLKKESALNVRSAQVSDKTKGNSTTSFDVFAGTFVNYFENNPVKVNAGFGINANIKVSKKFYLSMGAGVSENQISYENSLPSTARQALMSSFIRADGGPSDDVKINATLLNLDIPIALKFYPGKSTNFYLLTGINSNSYINQKYVESYNSFDFASNSVVNNQQQVEEKRLKGFDFANSAILGIGFNQPLGKGNVLIFEPYFKPSLKGIGDKNIRLNSIGLNLKLNINNDK